MDIVQKLRADGVLTITEWDAIRSSAADEIERLMRCIAGIEDELTRDPPRVGDALFICEAARAVNACQQQAKPSAKDALHDRDSSWMEKD